MVEAGSAADSDGLFNKTYKSSGDVTVADASGFSEDEAEVSFISRLKHVYWKLLPNPDHSQERRLPIHIASEIYNARRTASSIYLNRACKQD